MLTKLCTKVKLIESTNFAAITMSFLWRNPINFTL